MPHRPVASLLDTSPYDRVIALDTQMIFEARPLVQLDWAALSAEPVLLLILPQVSSEVDARKRDGRLGPRARELNRLLDPSIESGRPTVLVREPVRIDLAYVASGRIEWDRLEDFERDNGDDRIVAQAMHALIDDPSRVEVMSFDSRPRAAARRHGIKALKPDESWLLAPEPSPAERRAAELEQRVRTLQANEPELRVHIRIPGEPPLVRLVVPPLPAEVVNPVTRMILARHPPEPAGRFMASSLHTNPDYDDEYDAYAQALRANDVPHLHRGVARQFSQYGVEVVIENAGVLAAQHLAVEMRSGNAVLHEGPYLVDIFGPAPPSPDRDLLLGMPSLYSQLAQIDRAAFATRPSEDPEVQVEYRCQDFRHGRTHTLTAVLELVESTGLAAHLEVRVTAANMRGAVTERVVVPVAVRERSLGELIDLDTLELREAPPVQDLLLPLLDDEDRRDEITRFRNDGTRQG